VALTTVTEAAAVPPKFTVAPDWKLLPVMVTVVPPATGPEFGETLVMEDGELYVKEFDRIALCPSGLVTLISAVPAACGGDTV
jgi:hypothetical protein